jgi:FKBP-type peptidyl-prolyl cis-trans isomerase (trigger factor)
MSRGQRFTDDFKIQIIRLYKLEKKDSFDVVFPSDYAIEELEMKNDILK